MRRRHGTRHRSRLRLRMGLYRMLLRHRAWLLRMLLRGRARLLYGMRLLRSGMLLW